MLSRLRIGYGAAGTLSAHVARDAMAGEWATAAVRFVVAVILLLWAERGREASVLWAQEGGLQ